MQKHGLTPDQKLRKAIYDPLEVKNSRSTSRHPCSEIILHWTKPATSNDLLKTCGYTLKELRPVHTGTEYQKLGRGKILISCYPPAKYGAADAGKTTTANTSVLPAVLTMKKLKKRSGHLQRY